MVSFRTAVIICSIVLCPPGLLSSKIYSDRIILTVCLRYYQQTSLRIATSPTRRTRPVGTCKPTLSQLALPGLRGELGDEHQLDPRGKSRHDGALNVMAAFDLRDSTSRNMVMSLVMLCFAWHKPSSPLWVSILPPISLPKIAAFPLFLHPRALNVGPSRLSYHVSLLSKSDRHR